MHCEYREVSMKNGEYGVIHIHFPSLFGWLLLLLDCLLEDAISIIRVFLDLGHNHHSHGTGSFWFDLRRWAHVLPAFMDTAMAMDTWVFWTRRLGADSKGLLNVNSSCSLAWS
jgi:hypothetical protein